MVSFPIVMLGSGELRGFWGFGVLATSVALTACTGDAFFTDDGSGGAGAVGTGASSNGGSGAAGAGSGNGGEGTGGSLGEPCEGGGVCVPEAPDGWMGPVAIVESGAGPQPCSGDFPNKQETLVANPTSHDAECSACSCADPNGQTCVFGVGSSYAAANCGGPAIQLPALDDGCSDAAGAGGFAAIEYPNGTLGQPGSCSPQGGGVSGLPPGFDNHVTLCAPSGAGAACGMSGNTCLPVPESPFAMTFCIYKPGEVECPAQTYRNEQVLNVGQDTRGCSDCDCGTPSGPCVGTIGVFTSPTCDDGLVASGPTGDCLPASVTDGGIKFLETEPVECPASGGEPVGEASLGSEYTLCCIGGG